MALYFVSGVTSQSLMLPAGDKMLGQALEKMMFESIRGSKKSRSEREMAWQFVLISDATDETDLDFAIVVFRVDMEEEV